MSKPKTQFPVVDLFAGPGGLGEGFGGFCKADDSPFKSVAAMEHEDFAYQTLLLRHFFRSFKPADVPDDYYRYLEGSLPKEMLIAQNSSQWKNAERTVWKLSLGSSNQNQIKCSLNRILKGINRWVLVGGPPCQAYSLAGRSRMKSNLDFANDARHYLYKEYLKIIEDHRPPVFLMENVKGILSATVNGQRIFEIILKDLSKPNLNAQSNHDALRYRLYSLSEATDNDLHPKLFVVKSEEYGVPQARHRVFILGIRSDLDIRPDILVKRCSPVVQQVIGELPKIRSGVSRKLDSIEMWKQAIEAANFSFDLPLDRNILSKFNKKFDSSIANIRNCQLSRSSSFYSPSKVMESWYTDDRLGILTGHEARTHMETDLHRYLFAAVYAATLDVSPKLSNFPQQLLPAHNNINSAATSVCFPDRFRVQIGSRVSTTITSHISKDGHYYIHYDPTQCRSLSVREAARLQTFPDNYFFEGPRTAQYHQVGNAVPPYLAMQIAGIVKKVLDQMPSR